MLGRVFGHKRANLQAAEEPLAMLSPEQLSAVAEGRGAAEALLLQTSLEPLSVSVVNRAKELLSGTPADVDRTYSNFLAHLSESEFGLWPFPLLSGPALAGRKSAGFYRRRAPASLAEPHVLGVSSHSLPLPLDTFSCRNGDGPLSHAGVGRGARFAGFSPEPRSLSEKQRLWSPEARGDQGLPH